MKIGGCTSDGFSVLVDLRQGDPLALRLLNIALQATIVNSTEVYPGGKWHILFYADDVVSISRSLLSAEEVFLKLDKEARKIGR